MNEKQSDHGKGRAKPGTFSQINRDLTIMAGLRSTVGQTRRSVRMMRASADGLLQASRDAMAAGRVETFKAAMERTGVLEEDLPLVHNQIVLQCYTSLVVGVIAAAVSVNYIVSGQQVAAAALSLLITVTSLFYFAQSSTQAMQIRHRELGLLSTWVSSPREWFPRRLTQLRRMSRSDPLRHPDAVRPLAQRARRAMFAAAIIFGVAFGIRMAHVDAYGGPWSVLLSFIGMAFLLTGGRVSFEVFRRRVGLHCDIAYWLLSPADWIPSVKDPRSDGLLEAAKAARVARKGEAGAEQGGHADG